MPCMPCGNGKWKYGENGNCQFDSKDQCERAAAAIHAKPKEIKNTTTKTFNHPVTKFAANTWRNV